MKLRKKIRGIMVPMVMSLSMLAGSSVAYAAGGVPQPIPGDVDLDGEVTMDDAQLALKAALKIVTLSYYAKQAADIDKDGEVTMDDAQAILNLVLKI